MKRSSIPTPLAQPQLSSAQPQSLLSLGSPQRQSSLRVPRSQDKKAFLSAGRAGSGPSPARRGRRIPSLLFSLRRPTMGAGARGRRRLGVCLTSWSSSNGGLLSSLPPLDFLHLFLFLSCPGPTLPFSLLEAQGRGGPALTPVTCRQHPPCLVGLPVAFLLAYLSSPSTEFKSNTSSVLQTPPQGHVGQRSLIKICFSHCSHHPQPPGPGL